MEMNIPARTVYAVLHAVQEISGQQYAHLLQMAGWSRFQRGIPAPSNALIATRAELEQLFSSVYTLLGEGLMRLFLRNYGRLLGEQILANPTAGGVVALWAAIPPAERQLAAFVGVAAQISNRFWATTTRSEDAQAYYLAYTDCPLCRGVPHAGAPLCATTEALYRLLAKELLGYRLQVVEIECAATGAPRCKVAFYKEGYEYPPKEGNHA